MARLRGRGRGRGRGGGRGRGRGGGGTGRRRMGDRRPWGGGSHNGLQDRCCPGRRDTEGANGSGRNYANWT